ncbi:hypothetical protein ACFL51_01455 [Myxococcota bacterium]
MATTGVLVAVVEDPGDCPLCHGTMDVQKTLLRRGVTLEHGPFKVRETVHVCQARCRYPSGRLVTRRAQALAQCLPAGGVIGYDVMVHVGLERFLYHRQRQEIQTALQQTHGIPLSSGEISLLARRFLVYLEALHQSRAPALRETLTADGGWPMHVDATGEDGRGTLLVVKAGWREWVLGAWKLATERADLIGPCLRQTVAHFGPPCAVMRDMGRAMIPAVDDLVEELELELPVLTCHQHFLADLGKDLLEPAHAELRGIFRRAKVRPKLRELVRDLGRRLGTRIDEAREAVQDWQTLIEQGHVVPRGQDGLAIVRALAQWTLDYPADATGRDFPFDRPYLDFYHRCRTSLRALDAYLRRPPRDRKVVSALERMHRRLAPVRSEVPFQQIANRLRKRAALFDELRDTLRLNVDPANDETEQDLEKMRTQLEKLVSSLEARRPERGPAGDAREAIDVILEHLVNHGPTLWGHAITLAEQAGGGVRLVARTNNLLENFFHRIKHGERRRSGRKVLTRDLEHFPAAAALVYNLEKPDYVSIVCGTLNRLPETFAKLDRSERVKNQQGQQAISADAQDDLGKILQVASASLSTADRRVIRTEEMDRRVRAAARSRAPRRSGLSI